VRPAPEAGRRGWGLADHAAFLRRTLADQVANHDDAAGDAEPHRERPRQVQDADRIDDRKARPYRALRVILVRLRITEIDQHPVAHVFGDKAAEPRSRSRGAAVVGTDDLAQILGIKALRQRRRAHQIAEQHRQLPPLGLGRRRCGLPRHLGRLLGRGRRRGGFAQRRDGFKELGDHQPW
jgi:hypothetical protein